MSGAGAVSLNGCQPTFRRPSQSVFLHEVIAEPQKLLVEFSAGIFHLGCASFHANKGVSIQGMGGVFGLVC